MSEILSPRASIRIGVVSKYNVYFDDIMKSLAGSNVEIFCTSEINDLNAEVARGVNFDYLFFPHFSSMIPPDIFNNVVCVGFHTGDLPKDRGGSPIQNKILKKQYATKVSAFIISEILDGGELLCQRDIDLENGSIAEIIESISLLVSDMVREIIAERPKSYPQIGQPEYMDRVAPNFSRLELSTLSLKDLYDRVRMVDGFGYPPAFIELNSFKISLGDAKLVNGKLEMKCTVEEA